jgi:2-deoxy-D-gluconate 3-dehydrogenase
VPERSLSSHLDLSDRHAVVTGAGQGFGAAIARRLGEAGATVIVADRELGRARQVAGTITAVGGKAHAHACDVSVEREVSELFENGQCDVLVNNAGVFSNALIDELAPKEFLRVQEVNVFGAFLCAQAFARSKGSTADAWRAIVNVASVDAFHPSAEGLVHYTTSKHALTGLTKSLAMELASQRIRVNAVCPGASVTEGVLAMLEDGTSDRDEVERQWDGIAQRTPMRRMCTPDDVARAAVFLASDLASFVTGALLPVDGGILVQPLEGYRS